jgi:hypothetical protein
VDNARLWISRCILEAHHANTILQEPASLNYFDQAARKRARGHSRMVDRTYGNYAHSYDPPMKAYTLGQPFGTRRLT